MRSVTRFGSLQLDFSTGRALSSNFRNWPKENAAFETELVRSLISFIAGLGWS